MTHEVILYGITVLGLCSVGFYLVARTSWSLWEEFLGVLGQIHVPRQESPTEHARALYGHFRWQTPPDEEGMMLAEALIARLSLIRKKRTRKTRSELSKNG